MTTKWINSEGEILVRESIVITENGKNYYNPNDDVLIRNGWNTYIEKEDINKIKQEKILEIKQYDNSSNVNEFSIDGIQMWLDKSMRVGLDLRFKSEFERGKDQTVLWFECNKLTMPLNVAINFLYQLEEYAAECYDNTQKNIAEIMKMDNVDDIKSFDITIGYPNKLEFFTK